MMQVFSEVQLTNRYFKYVVLFFFCGESDRPTDCLFFFLRCEIDRFVFFCGVRFDRPLAMIGPVFSRTVVMFYDVNYSLSRG